KNLHTEPDRGPRRKAELFIGGKGKEYILFDPEKNQDIINKITVIQGREWDPVKMVWKVPLSEFSISAIFDILNTFHFVTTETATLRIENIYKKYRDKKDAIEKARSERETREKELYELSWAEDCDIILPDFGKNKPRTPQKVAPL